jgi:glutaredoxin
MMVLTTTAIVAAWWCLLLQIQSTAAFSASSAHTILQSSTTLRSPANDPIDADGSFLRPDKKSLVVLLPQLGEFDSSEYIEFLCAASPALDRADIDLKVIGIGDPNAARAFCQFTGLSHDKLFVDPDAAIHKALGLYSGPDFALPHSIADNSDLLKFFLGQLPGGVPDESQLIPVANAWLNYLAMCAGIGAKGTLREILRGYFGDSSAPERFRQEDVVKAGFITIGPGVGPVQIGPFKYQQWFADERGYQRPVELATVRLKNMVEVLAKWDTYVTNPLGITQRGGTFLFDENGRELYSYKSTGVLTYAEYMPRPLSFLESYIDKQTAINPLGLLDNGGGPLRKGRGILKPAGKFMGLLSFLFRLENKLQARLLGAEEGDYEMARREIQDTIAKHNVVVYTYGLSPFSSEALALLDECGIDYEAIEIGLEWFLLDKEKSVLRAVLLEKTGQSSLPHVFINGEHVGGLFTGSSDEKYPGLAGLKESGALMQMVTKGGQ